VNDTCAAASRAVEEPLAGTAAAAVGWVLVEQAGAWGRDAVTASGLDPAVGAALQASVADLPVRLQVIRRPSSGPTPTLATTVTAARDTPGAGGRTVVLAHAGTSPWAERLAVPDDADLLDLDLNVTVDTSPPELGAALSDPLLLVCTHAKRDRCCATLGRPIADTLRALHRDATWEVSHVGGHRFAGNLVVLPHGLVYGGLDVASAVAAVDLHLAGRVDVAHLRGRSCWAPAAQAAEVFVRAELGLDAIDAVEGVRVLDDRGDGTDVEVATRDGAIVARVAKVPLGTRLRTSCDADEPEDPGGYRLVALRR
jgi:hypothetical protein